MILFIDDEKRFMESYVDELECRQLLVKYVQNVDEAMSLLETRLKEVEIVILDTMMPRGTRFQSVDTESGLTTGLHVYKWIRERTQEMPVIVFTNLHRHADVFQSDTSAFFW